MGETTLRLHDYSGAQAYATSTTEETSKFHLVHLGTDVAHLSNESQEEIEVDLVRKGGNPALIGYYFADMSPSNHMIFVC